MEAVPLAPNTPASDGLRATDLRFVHSASVIDAGGNVILNGPRNVTDAGTYPPPCCDTVRLKERASAWSISASVGSLASGVPSMIREQRFDLAGCDSSRMIDRAGIVVGRAANGPQLPLSLKLFLLQFS